MNEFGQALGFSLLDPWFLLLAPAVLVAFLWAVRRRRAALPAPSARLLTGLPRTLRSRLTWLPAALTALGVLGLVVALARPVTRDVVPIESEGVDIVLALDVSSSMDARDVEEDRDVRRVEAAREQALAFAEARENDRLGLVTFALFADLRCPPTLDREALSAFTRAADTVRRNGPEDGTAIGSAVALSTKILADVETGSRVVVLLTDGQETAFERWPEGSVDPVEAAKLAADEGVRVYTIGLGRAQRDVFGMVHEPDFSLIQNIAHTTGGQFFRARSGEDLAAVYAEIDRLEKRELEDPRFRTADWFHIPFLVGVLTLALGLALETAWIRGAP